jgi:hypothetical protein
MGARVAMTAPAMPAVIRTYRELRSSGQPTRFAFEAAVTVYLWHHPKASCSEAESVVEAWVRDGTLN